MSDVSFYKAKQNAFSLMNNRPMHFRLTYERVFLRVNSIWRDFLIHSEEIGLARRAEIAVLAV